MLAQTQSLAAAVLLASASLAQAATVYDSGVTPEAATLSSPAYNAFYEIATEFSLGAGSSITGATLVGSGGTPGAFTLNFYADAGSSPETTAAATVTVSDWTRVETTTADRFVYTLDFSEIVLAAGTWWFAAYAETAWNWSASSVDVPATVYRVAGTSSSWTAYNGYNHAYTLTNGDSAAVPLPAALPLLGAALAGLGLFAARGRRAA
ncbi:hypothetical protein P2H44_08845 [Albimonas sp. CAU 1670]|uniref:hypothetical protein n=1 Tax=Albimonas sp. CAU 1670 TaxID=3032599 RepID=UPI0023DBFA1B|nr:hypothetical protein [Albimonas sp. CAU 1670]MDF2232658.1 hypothetical protein [Albimonas sp. CAU 1670]